MGSTTCNYTLDNNGNTTSGDGASYTWNALNQMTTCVRGGKTYQFTYGVDGICTQMKVSGEANPTNYYLDGSSVVRSDTINPSGVDCKLTYLVGPRGPEFRIDHTVTTTTGDPMKNTTWYLTDGLGSVVGEVNSQGIVNPDSSGQPQALRKFDVFGALRATDPGTTSHKFVGSLGHSTGDDGTGLIDVTGDAMWKAMMAAFERLPL